MPSGARPLVPDQPALASALGFIVLPLSFLGLIAAAASWNR
ncbi:MAG: hypothetical protein ACLSHC_01055 [Bilophila wadsworthia]